MKAPVPIGLVAALGATLIVSCAASNARHTESSTSGVTASDQASMRALCPAQVPGTTVVSQEVEGGAAFVFITRGNVGELRERVRAMAQRRNQLHAGPMGQCPDGADCPHRGEDGHHGSGGMLSQLMMPAAMASVEDIEGGARLVLRPSDPAQLPALREHVASRAQRMAKGECSMMGPRSERATSPSQQSEDHQR